MSEWQNKYLHYDYIYICMRNQCQQTYDEQVCHSTYTSKRHHWSELTRNWSHNYMKDLFNWWFQS